MAAAILNPQTRRVAEFAPSGRLTEAQYDAERERIRQTYGDNATERTGAFDQELARLFYRSGWTQEQLAKVEHKSKSWADRVVRFGRFLGIPPTGGIPKSLTERRFRGYWERTDSKETNERIRFREVERLMDEELTFSKSHVQKPRLARIILEKFGDGHWHRLDIIVKGVEANEADVLAVLEQMRARGTYHTACERRKGGATWSYRIVRGIGRKVDVDVLIHELGPIVHALKVEGRKHIAEAAPAAIAALAKQLEVILERLTHEDARQFRRPASKEKKDNETV